MKQDKKLIADALKAISAYCEADDPPVKVEQKEQIDVNRPMGIKEAAEFLNLKPATLYFYVNKNIIPHYKPNGKGGKVYFKRCDLEAYAFRNKVKSDADLNAMANHIMNNLRA